MKKRNIWERRLLIGLACLFACCILLLLFALTNNSIQSFNNSFPTPNGYEAKMYNARLEYADLPDGYRSAGRPNRVENTPGYGLSYTFYPVDFGITTRVSQDLVVFEDSVSAEHEFTALIAYYQSINLKLIIRDQQTDKYVDKLANGCDGFVRQIINSSVVVETQYCVTISMYRNVISVVNAHVFSAQLLTIEKYEALIETLNQRIVTAFGQSY